MVPSALFALNRSVVPSAIPFRNSSFIFVITRERAARADH